jgi:hypothetical protein
MFNPPDDLGILNWRRSNTDLKYIKQNQIYDEMHTCKSHLKFVKEFQDGS